MDQNLHWHFDTDVSGQYGAAETTSDFDRYPRRKVKSINKSINKNKFVKLIKGKLIKTTHEKNQ